MADSYAKVRFKDGTIKYVYFQNTSDYLGNKLFDTLEEVTPTYDCACKHAGEEVVIAQHYGGGTTWYGRACKECGYITFNYEEYLDYMRNNSLDALAEEVGYTKDGLPDWYWVE